MMITDTETLTVSVTFSDDLFPQWPVVVSPEVVQRMENLLLTMPQADIVTVHTFAPGVYERKIIVPPWTVLTGAEHRTAYRVRLEAGTIAVNTDDGIKVLTAPLEFDAPAGIKRVGRVFEDEVVWVDIYPNPDDCTDMETLEHRLYVVPDIGMGETRAAARVDAARVDYREFLRVLGMTAEEVHEIASDERDLVPMPNGVDVEVRESRIHGLGMFATRSFEAGDVICPGRIRGHRTPAGRFINHSPEPNAEPVIRENGDIDAVAKRRILPFEEILVDYRDSMRVNLGIDMRSTT